MKKETYVKITRPFRENPKMAKGVHIVNLICSVTMYLAYPILLLSLLIKGSSWEVWRAILVPAFGFVSLSIARRLINRPRPYETFDLPPVFKKETKGNSFPSRHVFSATMIGMSYLMASPWFVAGIVIGIILMILATVLALVRVVSGIHYPSDVLAGAGYGVLVALVGYLVF